MFKEREIVFTTTRMYVKPYVQKIKSIIWNKFESTCEVEDRSFESDETPTIALYFVVTDDQFQKLQMAIPKLLPDLVNKGAILYE
ncbi:hypothetical protein [Enterococcus casseliflavus]|uniref:hypothetical protein n=1 Tax=Enterococcus casseliflavus TaxID=37734 RepID=UPI003D6B9CC2